MVKFAYLLPQQSVGSKVEEIGLLKYERNDHTSLDRAGDSHLALVHIAEAVHDSHYNRLKGLGVILVKLARLLILDSKNG